MKLNKKWIAVLLLVVMALCLTACGEKKEGTPKTPAAIEAPKTIVGLWDWNVEDSLIADGMSAEEAREVARNLSEYDQTYEFTADGRMIMTEYSSGDIRTEELPYTLEGDQIFSQEMLIGTYKLEGDKLTITTAYYSPYSPYVFYRIEKYEMAEPQKYDEPALEETDSESLIGKWHTDYSDAEYLEFSTDNVLYITRDYGEIETTPYSVEGDVITGDGFEMIFRIEGDTLYVQEGDISNSYTRVR